MKGAKKWQNYCDAKMSAWIAILRPGMYRKKRKEEKEMWV